jgi:pimeloyl-ACP methyl ester carboxylesterase
MRTDHAPDSMRSIDVPARSPSTRRIFMAMLPAAGNCAEDFRKQGIIDALHRLGLPIDVTAIDASMDCYLDGRMALRLKQQVVEKARAQNYSAIWLMGISLGGMGALACESECGRDVTGVILLAPFIGVRGLIAEVSRAGGLDHWQPGAIGVDDEERRLVAWLKAYRADVPGATRIYLGYGSEDRYARASRMVSERLPPQRVFSLSGGHDWPTWTRLWERIIDEPSLFQEGPGGPLGELEGAA